MCTNRPETDAESQVYMTTCLRQNSIGGHELIVYPVRTNGIFEGVENEAGFTPTETALAFMGSQASSAHSIHAALGAFEVRCNFYGDYNSVSHGYYDVRCTSTDLTELMAKNLRRIERGMERLYEREGAPSSFGSYCVRVMKLIGAKGLLVKKEEAPSSRFPGDPRMSDYRVLKPEQARERLDALYAERAKEGSNLSVMN